MYGGTSGGGGGGGGDLMQVGYFEIHFTVWMPTFKKNSSD